MRWQWAIATLVGGGAAAVGCGGSSGGGHGFATTTAAVVSSGGAPAATPPADPLSLANRQSIARTFAPRVRFNGYHDDGNGSRQNRHEDFFPMSVASFLRELHARQARLIVQGSSRLAPGESELRPVGTTVLFEPDRLNDYPRDMTGDPPGAAPLYTHVYDDPAARALAPDGSGALEVWVDYWFFYPYDRADVRILLVIPLSGPADIIGHRSDWEHVQFKVRVAYGPGGVLLPGGELLEGYYYGHGWGLTVAPTELERTDDLGTPDPSGTHPVVYVAQGKHASYPQAGEWAGAFVPTWIADYTDFFRGNGVIVDWWNAPLFDLDDPAAAPAEFSPPELQALWPASSTAIADWTRYRGRWGPDQIALNTPLGNFSTGSPRGPVGRADYGDFGGRGAHERWSDLKARKPDLKIYADLGVTIPQVSPPPAPVRR